MEISDPYCQCYDTYDWLRNVRGSNCHIKFGTSIIEEFVNNSSRKTTLFSAMECYYFNDGDCRRDKIISKKTVDFCKLKLEGHHYWLHRDFSGRDRLTKMSRNLIIILEF